MPSAWANEEGEVGKEVKYNWWRRRNSQGAFGHLGIVFFNI
jgi:hypothetical protein